MSGVKIFVGSYATVEDRVNQWVAARGVVVTHIAQSPTEGKVGENRICLTVCYTVMP